MATESGHLSIGVWVSAAILGLLIFRRIGQMGRASVQKQNLNLGGLWLSALVYAALASSVIALQPPHGAEWWWLAAGAALGGALGWWRGMTVEITVHPINGTLLTRTSLTAVVFLVGLVALRYGLSYLLVNQAEALHVSIQLATGTLLAFALGLVLMQRVEMTLRALRLLGKAAVRGAAAPGPAAGLAAPVSAEPSPEAAAAAIRMRLSTTQLAMLAVAIFVVVIIVGLALPR